MNTLIEAHPSIIRRLVDSTLFYFGTQTVQVYLLPGKAKFEIVHSPVEPYGWEYVCYQWFGERNGLWILDRRALEPDEIDYFESLLAQEYDEARRSSC